MYSRGSQFTKMAGFKRLPVYAGHFWILVQKQRLEILVFCLHPDYPRVIFLKWINILEYILQHTATHHNTLQQPATHYNTLVLYPPTAQSVQSNCAWKSVLNKMWWLVWMPTRNRKARIGWRSDVGCLILTGYFPQKSPKISISFAGRDLQLKASCAYSPSCIGKYALDVCVYESDRERVRAGL